MLNICEMASVSLPMAFYKYVYDEDTAIVTMERRIGKHTQAFKWYHCQ